MPRTALFSCLPTYFICSQKTSKYLFWGLEASPYLPIYLFLSSQWDEIQFGGTFLLVYQTGTLLTQGFYFYFFSCTFMVCNQQRAIIKKIEDHCSFWIWTQNQWSLFLLFWIAKKNSRHIYRNKYDPSKTISPYCVFFQWSIIYSDIKDFFKRRCIISGGNWKSLFFVVIF